jgi:hypothetical protein
MAMADNSRNSFPDSKGMQLQHQQIVFLPVEK